MTECTVYKISFKTILLSSIITVKTNNISSVNQLSRINMQMITIGIGYKSISVDLQ